MDGYIHSLESFGAADGPGVRFVVFFQGCPLRCLYCHNPDAWNREEGKVWTTEALMTEILKYRSFIGSGGVTFSGGEPLAQPEFLSSLLSACREQGLHTAVDTSGGVPLSRCRESVEAADLLLLDIKAFSPELCKRLTGRDGEPAWEILRLREELQKPVWIRHVLVPGLTLDDGELEGLAVALKDFSCVQRVELLPFHKLGEYKWKTLGRAYELYDTPAPSSEEVESARRIFMRRGLSCPERG